MRQLLRIGLSIPALTAALILIGCGAKNDDGATADTASPSGADGGTSDTGADSTTADDSGDTGPGLPAPYWYGLDAEVSLTDGALVDATFRVRVSGQDTSLPVNCVGERALESAALLDIAPDPMIYQWWRIETAPDDGTCEGADALPTSFYLGLGELHIDVLPALTRAGLDADAVAPGLYSAYASIPGGEAFCGGDTSDACVFGYAGTPTDFDEGAKAVTNAPLPDGLYGVTAAFYFPVE